MIKTTSLIVLIPDVVRCSLCYKLRAVAESFYFSGKAQA